MDDDKNKKEEMVNAEETSAEAVTVETPVEEVKAEETEVAETPVEEKTEEAAVEENAPEAEETVEEEVKSEEPVVEEKAEEVKEEVKEEVVEETKEEPKEEKKEEVSEEKSEETAEPVEKEKPKKKVHPDARWYVINSYSGHEKKVAQLIEQRVKANELEKLILEVLVPTQEKILVSEGKKKTLEEKIFPGYVLVHMVMNDETWYLVRNTEGVTGFVGTQRKPTPLSEEEVKGILAFSELKQPSFQASFAVGDAVKVGDGPFKDFVGSISEINEDKGQVKVLLSVFGRETPVVLDFLQVSKL